jgi:hypothetical protein
VVEVDLALVLAVALYTHVGFDAFDDHIDRPLSLLLMVKIHQPSHEFTFGVGMTFVSYPLVLIPVV